MPDRKTKSSKSRQMAQVPLGPLSCALVGANETGIGIGLALQRANLEVLCASSNDSDEQERAAHVLDIPVFDDVGAAITDADLVFLCVEAADVHATITNLIEAVEGIQGDPMRFVVTMPLTPLDALQPLHDAGHTVVGLRPLCAAWPIDDINFTESLPGVPALVSGMTPAEREFAHAVAHALGWLSIDVEETQFDGAIAAARLAWDGTVAVTAAAQDLCDRAGLDAAASRASVSAIAQAASNATERDRAEAALDGPAAAGDANTLGLLLTAVERETPHHTRLMREVEHANVHIGVSSGLLSIDDAATIEHVIQGSTGEDETK